MDETPRPQSGYAETPTEVSRHFPNPFRPTPPSQSPITAFITP